MKLRQAHHEDSEDIMKIINQAKGYFKQVGIDQWQDGYPNVETILDDMKNHEAYVLEDNGLIVATCMITIRGEASYQVIDGQWLSDLPYICIHRIAVDNQYKGKGLAKIVLDQAIALFPQYQSLRMDTHDDNHSMQRFLNKYGFHPCGHITLASGGLRIGFEKLL